MTGHGSRAPNEEVILRVTRLSAEYTAGILAGFGIGSMMMGAMAYWRYLDHDNGLVVALLLSPWLVLLGSWLARRAQARQRRENRP